MSKFDVRKIIKDVSNFTDRRKPEILTAIGIAGMFTTVVTAVRATPKALCLIDEEYMSRPSGVDADLTKTEVIKATWKCYVPSLIIGVSSAACIIGANSVHAERNAAITTAYTLSQTVMREYQNKVSETIGEKKEKIIRDTIAQDRLDRNPVSNSEIIITEKGNTLCYDEMTGRYFKSDIEALRNIENEINKELRSEMFIPLNDFYYKVNLKPTASGELLGWDIDNGMEIEFSSNIADDGTPCLVIMLNVRPKYAK